jgi:hypothetical protein
MLDFFTGGIWLLILGEWRLVLAGFVLSCVSLLVVEFALAPSLIFAFPAAHPLRNGNAAVGFAVGMLSSLYATILFALWCMLVFWHFEIRATQSSYIPTLLWSYAIAVVPLSSLAGVRDLRNNVAAAIPNFFAHVGYLFMLVPAIFFNVAIDQLVMLFAAVNLIGLILGTVWMSTALNQSLRET